MFPDALDCPGFLLIVVGYSHGFFFEEFGRLFITLP
jgi:hypothetical protein